jgi:hypothetical protein
LLPRQAIEYLSDGQARRSPRNPRLLFTSCKPGISDARSRGRLSSYRLKKVKQALTLYLR